MGIGDIDSLLNGRLPALDWQKAALTGEAVGGYHSPLYVAGLPGAGSAPSAGVNGAQVLNGRSGTLRAPAAAAGKSCYLNFADFSAVSGVGSAFLVDRLWENSGLSVTLTSLQAIAPVALPARDANGSADGAGVFAGLEITATLGAATATATLTYTDSDGNAGNTAQVSIPSGCVAGTLLIWPLAAGDYGVRGPTGFQLTSSMLSGSFSIVLMRRLGRKLRALSTNPDSYGPADGGHGVADGIAPQFVYILSATSVGATDGTVEFVQA